MVKMMDLTCKQLIINLKNIAHGELYVDKRPEPLVRILPIYFADLLVHSMNGHRCCSTNNIEYDKVLPH